MTQSTHSTQSMPPSTPPPAPSTPRPPLPSSSSRFPAGWSPGEDDTSLMAVDWRGSTALRVARRVERKHDELAPEVAKLSAVLERFIKLVKWVAVFFGLAVAAPLAKSFAEWVLSFHH